MKKIYTIFFLLITLFIGSLISCGTSEINIDKELQGIKPDSIFTFADVIDLEFDTLYFIKPYDGLKDDNNLNISDSYRDLLNRLTWAHDTDQAIIFVRNNKVVKYCNVYTHVLSFSHLEKQSYPANTLFVIRQEDRKELYLSAD